MDDDAVDDDDKLVNMLLDERAKGRMPLTPIVSPSLIYDWDALTVTCAMKGDVTSCLDSVRGQGSLVRVATPRS